MAAGDIILSDGRVITPEDLLQIAGEVKKLLAADSKELSQYEEIASLNNVSSLPAIFQQGSAYKLVRVALSVLKGTDGRTIELRATETQIQWRYLGEEVWNNLLDISDFVTITTNNLVNYYLKTETYTKHEITELLNNITTLNFKVVEELPASGESNLIYLVKKKGSGNDVHDEYLWAEGKWELIGSTTVDLTNYYTKTDADGKFALKTSIADMLTKTEAANTYQPKGDYALKSELPKPYTLPIATAESLGGIKVGTGLSIDPKTGVLSTAGGSTAEYEEIKGLKSSTMIVDIGSDNIDYINSLSCLSLLFYVKPTDNIYDWYRYIRIIDIENGPYNSEDNRPIISFNFDGGIYIFGSGQDFNHKIKGYKNLISINRIDGKAIGYSEMGKDFDEQLDRFKQNTFFPNHSNGQKPNGFRISTGDRKTFLYEWILFNFDIERLCRFNTVLLDFMRNRTAPGLIESCFIHKDKSIRVYEKYKPHTYQQLVLTQDEDGYYIGSTDSIDKYFIINRNHSSLDDIAYNKACEVKNVIQVISGSIKLSTVTVNTIPDVASLYKIKNIDTGEEIESTEELGEGTYEIIVDNLYLNRYGTSFKVISPCTIRFITETITPYSCIYQLKFDRLYKGDKVINGVNNELIPIKTYDSNSPLTTGFVQFDSSEFKSIGPNRSPRFIGEKWYNTATGDIYEAGDLTSFKKINS